MQVNGIYKFHHKDKEFQVHPSRAPIAQAIDKNEDHLLQDDEIATFMRQRHYLKDPNLFKSDIPQILEDFKAYLKGEPLPQAKGYHTYESAVKELQSLATQHPDLAQFVVLGKSAEGRDLVALKISSGAQCDTSYKRGVVITGLTHAREWATMESAMKLANDLVSGYDKDEGTRKKLDNLEIWVVPLVNPDGYVHSRTEDPWWRKNRRPVTDTGCGNESLICRAASQGASGSTAQGPEEPAKHVPIGVDLNRNYYDGNPDHFELYRPKGDTPCNTFDDFGWATSDDPESDVYRGPSGGSEPEVKTVLDLELKKPNIIGIVDLHSYGEMLLYPWGHAHKEVPNLETYKEIGTRVNKAMGNQYDLMQSIDLYATSGSSEDMHQANGKISFTFEIGRSFHTPEKELPKLTELVTKGLMAFLDWAAEQQKPPASA